MRWSRPSGYTAYDGIEERLRSPELRKHNVGALRRHRELGQVSLEPAPGLPDGLVVILGI